MPRRIQSILAIAAGFVLIVILAFDADASVSPGGGYSPDDLKGFAMVVGGRVLITLLGSYATALAAPRRPLRHALELGWLVTLCMAVACWHDRSRGGQIVNQISTLVAILPAAWLGGTLRARQLSPA